MSSMLKVAAVLSFACAGLVAAGNPADEWDRLDITWPKFSGLPITEDAAISGGWDKFSADDCTIRYAYQGDPSTFLLYDKTYKKFAGIQVGTKNENQNGHLFPHGPWLAENVNGTTLYTFTALTRNPYTLCNPQSSGNPIGEGLWFQHGPFSANNFHAVPMYENTLPGTGFEKGKCFVSMGNHYWKNLTNTMDCSDAYPVFLLYNHGQLNAFGWALTNLPEEQGARWEHPSGEVIKLFFDPARTPTCLFDEGRVESTQHIYFTQPALDLCY